MLLEFSFKNWKCFKELNTFSMDANTRLKNNKEHLLTVKYQQTGKSHEAVLPFSAMYGANNSGKTSFVDAIAFCKRLICFKHGDIRDLKAYCLGEHTEKSFFSFIFFMNDKIYQYEFTLDKTQIYYEKLLLLKPTTEQILFVRDVADGDYSGALLEGDREFMTLIKRMPTNKLFVSHMVEQAIDNKEHFEAVYDWFDDKLILVSPDTRDGMNDIPLKLEEINASIKQFDLGIDSIELEIASERTLKEELPRSFYDFIVENIRNNRPMMLALPDRSLVYVTKKIDSDSLDVHKIMLRHQTDDGQYLNFEFNDESDGTRRIIELLPLLLKLKHDPNTVVIIDEVDRSLHTQLAKELIREHILAVLDHNAKSQLIITTHDTHLLDLSFLRKDEFWLVQKEDNGAKLVAFDEFILKSDKKLSKYYLSGSLGGTPFI
ncbi:MULTISPECIES: AAA family ATPase [Cysteiniphilum]|uniref:Transporter n=1 Tax=Cysteiniphilum litorale TaxID=2056700 RepID=A0A8J2Z4R9_9GAMM|nr:MULTISPECIES: ATP-binding protein [Cysteiniphilum]GGF97639.1 transporter [Cysteiniphilum litorale]